MHLGHNRQRAKEGVQGHFASRRVTLFSLVMQALELGEQRMRRFSVAMLVTVIFIGGCGLSPSLAVAGAYFPDWLFCIIGAVILTLLVNALLARLQWKRSLGAPVLFYPALVLLFSLIGWLIFFQH
jgi:hypothetical protein